MLNLNSRQMDLIKSMINEFGYITMGEYAKRLNVSQRTLFNDLKIIEEQLSDKNIVIEKKPRIGIKMIASTSKRSEIISYINQKNKVSIELSTVERQLEILRLLLIDEETVSYQKLADTFWVSKTSISKDMEYIQDMLNSKTVVIESTKRGTKAKGNEGQVQYTLKRYTERLLKEKGVVSEKDFFKYAKTILKDVYPGEIVEIVFDETLNFERDLNVALSYYYIKSLIITLIIYTFRLTKGKHISLNNKLPLDGTNSRKNYPIAEEILSNISKKVHINISKSDIEYINKQLLAHCIKPETEDRQENKKYENVVIEIMQRMSEIMNIDFRWDKKLYDALILHVVPMIYRMDMGIRIQNPLINEIKKEYSVVLNSTWYVMAKLAEDLNIVVTEDEVGFIAVHFQAAIDRNEEVKRILIVCPTGISTSELIANKIKRYLPAKDIIEVISVRELYKKDIKTVDLIISSVNLDSVNKPVVQVSALISNEDLKNIYKYYSKIAFNGDEISSECKFTTNYIKDIVDEDLIFTGCDFKTKDESISFIISEFERANLTFNGFRESVLDREDKGSTALDSFVAIPHAMPSTVKESKLGIVTLKKPVIWSNKLIHTIVLISFAEKDLGMVKNILSELYAIVSSKDVAEDLFKNRSKKEISERLGVKK